MERQRPARIEVMSENEGEENFHAAIDTLLFRHGITPEDAKAIEEAFHAFRDAKKDVVNSAQNAQFQFGIRLIDVTAPCWLFWRSREAALRGHDELTLVA